MSDEYLRQTPTLALTLAVQRDLPDAQMAELEEAFNLSESWRDFYSYAGQVAAVVNGVVGVRPYVHLFTDKFAHSSLSGRPPARRSSIVCSQIRVQSV